MVYSFAGTPSLVKPTMSGDEELVDPSEFVGAPSLPLPTFSGKVNKAKLFSGAITLPNMNSGYVLYAPIAGVVLLTPSEHEIGLDGNDAIVGSFKAEYRFSGTPTLAKPVIASTTLALVRYSFTGTPSLAKPTIASTTMSIIRFLFGGTPVLRKPTMSGGILRDFNFSGSINLPKPRIAGRHEITLTQAYFGNPSPIDWDDPLYSPYVSYLTFPSVLTGSADDGSLGVRRPKLGNKLALDINPEIQISLSGKTRTYINTPAQYSISMSWDILNCNDTEVASLVGLLAFEQIYFTMDGTSWLLTLLDDVYKEIKQSRTTKQVTLNFKGVKLT